MARESWRYCPGLNGPRCTYRYASPLLQACNLCPARHPGTRGVVVCVTHAGLTEIFMISILHALTCSTDNKQSQHCCAERCSWQPVDGKASTLVFQPAADTAVPGNDSACARASYCCAERAALAPLGLKSAHSHWCCVPGPGRIQLSEPVSCRPHLMCLVLTDRSAS